MGCDHDIPLKETRRTCHFHASGFPCELGGRAIPCGTRYHLGCVPVSKPFTSCLGKGAGLQLPPLPDFLGYICEVCTVRSQTNSKLVSTPAMHDLLLLERMRFIDLVHAWSTNTLKQYQGGLWRIRAFETHFGIQVLHKFVQTAMKRRYSFDVGATALCVATTNTVGMKHVNQQHQPSHIRYNSESTTKCCIHVLEAGFPSCVITS